MLTAIDHLVIVVADLQGAIERSQRLGFSVVPGGRHTTSGTHNALIGLADGSYIELLAFYQPNPQSPWWGALDHGGGLSDFCVQTDDLRADVAAFRAAGIAMSDPSPMGRVRPDGFRLEWVLSKPGVELRGIVPFLIEDVTPREERVPRLTAHENRVTGLDTLTLAVDDATAVWRLYANVLPSESAEIERVELAAAGRRFVLGSHGLDIRAPLKRHGALLWATLRSPLGPMPLAADAIAKS